MNVSAPARERPDAAAIGALVDRLVRDYGERAVTNATVREQHGHGEGLSDPAPPDVVVYPHTNEEVAAIVRLCNAARVPVIAFGVGTSLEGHVAALYGGVCVDLSRMKRVLEVNPKHQLIRRMAALAGDNGQRDALGDLVELLLDQARIVEGEPLPDPGVFSRRMSAILAKGLAA